MFLLVIELFIYVMARLYSYAFVFLYFNGLLQSFTWFPIVTGIHHGISPDHPPAL